MVANQIITIIDRKIYFLIQLPLFNLKQRFWGQKPTKARNISFENELIVDLRNNIIQAEIPSNVKVDDEWGNNLIELKSKILKDNPLYFFQWDVIRRTMFMGNSYFLKREYKFLKSNNWNEVWKEATIESETIASDPYIFYPKSSGNAIHHAYHIAFFKNHLKFDFTQIDSIVEFGGGYGGMCRLWHNLGFKGKYIIFDLSLFSCLQQFYLRMNSLSVDLQDNIQHDASIKCISDIEILKNQLEAQKELKKLFIATWSLSESPISLRQNFEPLIQGFDFLLIAFQENFNGIDNVLYFNGLVKLLDSTHHCMILPFQPLSGHFYFFASKIL